MADFSLVGKVNGSATARYAAHGSSPRRQIMVDWVLEDATASQKSFEEAGKIPASFDRNSAAWSQNVYCVLEEKRVSGSLRFFRTGHGVTSDEIDCRGQCFFAQEAIAYLVLPHQ